MGIRKSLSSLVIRYKVPDLVRYNTDLFSILTLLFHELLGKKKPYNTINQPSSYLFIAVLLKENIKIGNEGLKKKLNVIKLIK